MTYYDKIANGYDELHREEQEKKMQIIQDLIKPKKHESLLDIGCGTGISMEPWDCKKIGIDPSEELLKQNPFETKKAEAESLPFEDSSFDYVTCVSSIHNFRDIDKAIEEIKRVAKDKIIITILRKSPKFDKIRDLIQANFDTIKIVLEEKDVLFLLENFPEKSE
ncbi:methyltransferase domain-containing protein [Candidatus Woesearchaeota archaeon]|nr:methyltransferase domain-containing protein [Candidatus Woesearchaeota archaeon]